MKPSRAKLWGIDMRKLVYLFVILFSIVACSQTPVKHREISLEKFFVHFIEMADVKQYEDAKAMLIDAGVKDLTEDITPEQISGYFSVVSSFRNFFLDKAQVFEVVNKGRGCLTANGYLESEPRTFKVSFVEEKGVWKIDMMHVMYLKSPTEFASKVICPEKDD